MREPSEPLATEPNKTHPEARPEVDLANETIQDAQALADFLTTVELKDGEDLISKAYLFYYLRCHVPETAFGPNLEASCRQKYAAQEASIRTFEAYPLSGAHRSPGAQSINYTINAGVNNHQPEGRLYINVHEDVKDQVFMDLVEKLAAKGINAGIKTQLLYQVPTRPSQMTDEQRRVIQADIARLHERFDSMVNAGMSEQEVQLAGLDLQRAKDQLNEVAVEEKKNRILKDYAEVMGRADKIVLYFNPDEQPQVLAFIDEFINTNPDAMNDVLPRFTARLQSRLGGHLPGVAFAEGSDEFISFGQLVATVARDVRRGKDYSLQAIISKLAAHNRDVEMPAFSVETSFEEVRQHAA